MLQPRLLLFFSDWDVESLMLSSVDGKCDLFKLYGFIYFIYHEGTGSANAIELAAEFLGLQSH